ASLCPPEVIIGLDGNEVETFGALSDEPLDAGVIGVGSVADQELVLPELAPWLGLRELLGGDQNDVLPVRPLEAEVVVGACIRVQVEVSDQPVELEEPESISVEPLSVAEQEVEGGKLTAIADRFHGAPKRFDHVVGIEPAHQRPEEMLGIGLSGGRTICELEKPLRLKDRPVVTVDVATLGERMGVLEPQSAHGGASNMSYQKIG